MLAAADSRPSMGVEIELAIFRAGQPVSVRSSIPSELLAAARCQVQHLPRLGRAGIFTCAGLFYPEMQRFLEVASWPATDLPSVLRAEDTALLEARSLLRVIRPDHDLYHMVCIADDLSGVPLPLIGRPRRRPAVSSSMGTHLNLLVPDGASKTIDLAITLACALSVVPSPA